MLVAISLPLVVCSILISAALIWMNRRGVGAAGSALAVLAVCVAIVVASGPMRLSRQALQYSLLFILVPGAVVFALSRSSFLHTRPWWLLIVGPLSFLMTVLVIIVTYNILFASTQSR